MTTTATRKVTKGMRFRSGFHDSNALWEVVRWEGGGAWRCRIVNEPITLSDGKTYDSDYAGVEKAFLKRDILRAVAWENYTNAVINQNDAYYESLIPGAIVHYSNSFGQYVRCVVTTDHRLLPVALVGEWTEKPRRRPTGEVVLPYYAEKIANHETFTPNYSNIFESPAFNHRHGEANPYELPVVDLSIPEMTAEEAAEAALWRKVDEIAAITNDRYDRQRFGGSPTGVLAAIREALDR